MNVTYRNKVMMRTFRTVHQHRFVNTDAKSFHRDRPQWIKPDGYDTKVSVYNPMTRCKVPLILKTENLLKWYMCGPTVYDSAHIGHAT